MLTRQALFQIISHSLTDAEADVRSNAAFASGVLVEQSEADLSSHFPALLQALQPFFSVPDHSAPPLYHARDNAAGALARLITKNAAALPIEQVVSVIVSVLPLRFDTLENRPVYQAIFALFRNQPQVVMPHIEALLKAFAFVLLDPSNESDTTDETKAEMRALVEHLKGQVPEQVAQAGFQ